MQLEILPNELLLHLFDFLDSTHLLRSFFGLNSRFDSLVYTHLQSHQFNFQSLSKDQFDLICQQHLPSIVDHLISLRLSHDETPDLVNRLHFHGFTLDRFISLRSLSLYHIHSLNILIRITHQCRYLHHLTHLIISQCHVEEKQKLVLELFNKIWNISKLNHCNLNGIELKHTSLANISAVLTSSSITDLFIEKISCNLECLSHLLRCTRRVQRLSTTIYSHSINDKLTFVVPSIRSLKIFFQGSVDSLTSIFSNMPHLHHLTIETSEIQLDGHMWKQILTDHLSRVEVFELKMKLELMENIDDDGGSGGVDGRIDELLDTYRTRFWLEEHRWYVRCDWQSSEITTYVFLYTLPFAFGTIYCLNECHTKSTCVDEEEYRSYTHVQIFENNYHKSFLLHNFKLVCVQFPNLRCLDIVLPSEGDFHSDNVMLNQLTSLTVRIQIVSAYDQLQILCDQAPRLYSLRIIFWRKFTSKLFQLTSSSIRRLELGGMLNWSNEFSKEECLAFCDSMLARQCEVLSIEVGSRASIVDLIERMSNLRLLNVRCRDDRWDHRKLPSTENELVHWIQTRFPPTYTIIRSSEKTSCIQVWIDQHDRQTKREASLFKSGHKVSQLLSVVQKLFLKK